MTETIKKLFSSPVHVFFSIFFALTLIYKVELLYNVLFKLLFRGYAINCQGPKCSGFHGISTIYMLKAFCWFLFKNTFPIQQSINFVSVTCLDLCWIKSGSLKDFQLFLGHGTITKSITGKKSINKRQPVYILLLLHFLKKSVSITVIYFKLVCYYYYLSTIW